MATDTFRASVQYDDWTGTAAADDLDQRNLRDLLIQKKLMDGEKEFLVGISFWLGENYPGAVMTPSVSVMVMSGNDFEKLEQSLKTSTDPINTRKIELELTLVEFIGLFKRFSVVLNWRGLGLQDREYRWND